MEKLMKNKKGVGARNIIISVVVLLLFGAMSMIGFYMMNNLLDTIVTSGVCSSNCDFAIAAFRFSVSILDPMIVFLLGILLMGLVVTSARVAVSKTSFVVTFIAAPLIGLVSWILNYVFIQFISVDILVLTSLQFPITILICTNLHWVALAMIILGSISFFAKKERGQFET